jgi:hypothetical protein
MTADEHGMVRRSAVIDRRYRGLETRSARRQSHTTSHATSIVVSVWLR